MAIRKQVSSFRPGKPMINCEPPASQNQRIAHLVLAKFLNGEDSKVIEIYHGLPVVVAAAVTVRVCFELESTEVREFNALLTKYS